jgi:pyruvate-formate lyase-activating enzyme
MTLLIPPDAAARAHVYEPLPADSATAMLFMTRRCNLDCSYCHMVHDGLDDPDQAQMKRSIDRAMDDFGQVRFHFFGGEPLLRFDLMKWAVGYIESRGGGRGYLLTTNGLLLKGERLEWLLEKGFNLMLSFDGAFESQKDMRVAASNNRGAYDAVMANVANLNARGIRYFVNMVISPHNVDRMYANVEHLIGLGVPTLQIAYELGANWTEPDRKAYLVEFERCLVELGSRVAIQNSPEAEPVLGSPFFVFDVTGEIFQGCAIVLEETLPTFNAAAKIGHLDSIGSLSRRQRSRIDQVTYFLRATRPNDADWIRIRSNMHLGYQLRHLMTKMGHRC